MKHGVYVNEKATELAKPRQTTTGIPFVVGLAPVHKLADPASAVNVPILCNTFAEAKAKLGYSDEFDTFTLCQSMFANLSALKVAPIIFVNVLDPSKAGHTKTVAATTVTITDGQGTLEEKYMLIDDNLVVKDDDTTLVIGTDYAVEHDENDYLVVTILSGTHTSVSVAGKALDPTGVSASDIIGGEDVSTGKYTGLSLINKVYPTFGLTAGTMIAPGFSKNATVAEAMAGLTEGINGVFRCEAIVDVDTTVYKKPSDAAAMKAAASVKDKHCTIAWPLVKIGSHVLTASAHLAALFQMVDYNQGAGVPYYPPSNKSAYVDSVVLADGTEMILTSEEGNILNDKGIATYIKAGGTIRFWGDETAAFPDTNDPKDVFINVRRFYSWYDNHLIIDHFERVDEPINRKVLEAIVDSENIFLNGLVSGGALIKGEVKVSEVNSVETLGAGKLYFDVTITVPTPAKDIEFTVSYDPEALMEALSA